MYSFGMIGTGIIAGCHLEAIAAHTRTRLAAVADVVRPRAEAAAAPFGAAVYTDYHQMLENEHLDAVIINLPHGLHTHSIGETNVCITGVMRADHTDM